MIPQIPHRVVHIDPTLPICGAERRGIRETYTREVEWKGPDSGVVGCTNDHKAFPS